MFCGSIRPGQEVAMANYEGASGNYNRAFSVMKNLRIIIRVSYLFLMTTYRLDEAQ
jgi:hypothetical protein